MMRCIVIDDEDIARAHMVRLLAAHRDVELTGQAANAIEGLTLIDETHPDVVFLDIEMPELTAFDMLTQLRHPPLVVFATAYDKYAVDAFEANAIDYLLKPIQAVRLDRTIDRLRATLANPSGNEESQLRRALSAMKPSPPARVAARRGKRIVLLRPADIVYARIEDELVFLHAQNERFLSECTIAELETMLAPAGFCRIRRSAIINLSHARELLPCSSGTWKVKLSDNTELGVSRARARELRARIG